jgi:urease accessory protein
LPAKAKRPNSLGGPGGPGKAAAPEPTPAEPPGLSARERGPLRIGIGGPVGSGKTALVAALCRALGAELSLAVVTNDIHTREDAELLLAPGRARTRADHRRADRLQPAYRDPRRHLRQPRGRGGAGGRVRAAGPGADRERRRQPDRDLQQGPDRPADLRDRRRRRGDRLPGKGGPGITSSDLLLVNKTDLAPHVHADLEAMRRDAAAQRSRTPGGAARDNPLPVLFTSLSEHPDAPAVADWIRELIGERRASG